jgi:hypothetical protein
MTAGFQQGGFISDTKGCQACLAKSCACDGQYRKLTMRAIGIYIDRGASPFTASGVSL